jgi:transposase
VIITPRCVGIDVSKHHLDIFDEGIGVSERVANAPHAITELVARWRCDALVVFEATGVYDLELRAALRAADIRFARVNPARARDFARASGQTRQDRPDRCTDARRLRARHAAGSRAGLYAYPQRLGAIGKTARSAGPHASPGEESSQ